MDATRQLFQMSKFPNTLSFIIIPGMFGGNFMKIDFSHEQIFYHKQRASTCEFCEVCNANKICK